MQLCDLIERFVQIVISLYLIWLQLRNQNKGV